MVNFDASALCSVLEAALPTHDVRVTGREVEICAEGRLEARISSGWWEILGCGFEARELDEVDDLVSWVDSALGPACSRFNVPLAAPSTDRELVLRRSDPWTNLGVIVPPSRHNVWAMSPVGDIELWEVHHRAIDGTVEQLRAHFGAGLSALGQITSWSAGKSTLHVVKEPSPWDGPVVAIAELQTVGIRLGGWVGRTRGGTIEYEPAPQGDRTYLDAILDLLADDDTQRLVWTGSTLTDSSGRYWLDDPDRHGLSAGPSASARTGSGCGEAAAASYGWRSEPRKALGWPSNRSSVGSSDERTRRHSRAGPRQHALGSRPVLALPPDTLRAIAERLVADEPSLRVDLTGSGLAVWRADEQVLLIDRGMLEVGPMLCDHWEIDDCEDLPGWFAAAIRPECTLIAVPLLVAPGEQYPSIESVPLGVVAPAGGLWCIHTVRTDSNAVWQVHAGEPRCELNALPEAMLTGTPHTWSLDERLPLTRFQSKGGASVYILAGPAPGCIAFRGFVDLPHAGVRAGYRLGVTRDTAPRADGHDLRSVASLIELAELDDERALRLDAATLRGLDGRSWHLAGPSTLPTLAKRD